MAAWSAGAARTALALLPFALLGVSGCERAAPRETPRAVLERLVELRSERRYGELAAGIAAGQGTRVAETLMALDGFLTANQRLCAHVRSLTSPGIAEMIDQSYLASNCDIFSAHVAFLDESVVNESATVGFTVDGRLPTRTARLRLVDGCWRYDPGDGFSPDLPDAFREMARGLRRVEEEVRSGRLAPDELRENPQALVDEVRVRLRPGIQRLPAPATADAGR